MPHIDDADFDAVHFSLRELTRSETAARRPGLLHQQQCPPQDVVDALQHLVRVCLDPLRTEIDGPIMVTSGYRSEELNARIGGSPTSQHIRGEAADIHAPGLARETRQKPVRDYVRGAMQRRGLPVPEDLGSDGWLFAYIALHLHRLDVDQVIHEDGPAWGRPAWVHVSASERQSRREILAIGTYTGGQYVRMTVEEALERLCAGVGA